MPWHWVHLPCVPVGGRGANRFAIHQRVIHAQHLALHVGLNQEGAKLLANPDVSTGDLYAFRVKVCTCQIAFFGSFLDDAERHFAVRIVQKNGFQSLELSALEVDVVAAQVQHEVRRVHFVACAVVREDPERAIVHAHNAGMALAGLAVKGSLTPVGRPSDLPSTVPSA